MALMGTVRLKPLEKLRISGKGSCFSSPVTRDTNGALGVWIILVTAIQIKPVRVSGFGPKRFKRVARLGRPSVSASASSDGSGLP